MATETIIGDGGTGFNDNEPPRVQVEVIEVPWAPGHWLVEAIDHTSEGEVYRTTFDGSMACQRALNYAQQMSVEGFGGLR